jgi:hypothetical protein
MRMRDTLSAGGVFELLNYHDHVLMLYHLVEIRKQSTLEQAEEPELFHYITLRPPGS